ncbi:hypothetical protein niasHS_016654 [Heterodera schachtii]|uniref:F-box domain-containing protein n=1 Tax=Heterodera schachtii TaxID=97005 RepID=A0ABD2IC97_HETSC
MATGIRLPQELLYDLLHFLSRSRRWARCRVNMAFDHHLLKQMGPWLMRVKQLIQSNEEAIQKICEKIRTTCGNIQSESRMDDPRFRVSIHRMRIFIRIVCPHQIAERMLKGSAYNDLECLLNSAINIVKKFCQTEAASADHSLSSIAKNLSRTNYRIDNYVPRLKKSNLPK